MENNKLDEKENDWRIFEFIKQWIEINDFFVLV